MSKIIYSASNETYTYYLMQSCAKMPTSCWGSYAKLAVIKQEIGVAPPRLIADTARGEVLYVRDRLHDGGSRSARAVAERELTTYIDNETRPLSGHTGAGNGTEIWASGCKVQVIEGGDNDSPSGQVLCEGTEEECRDYLIETKCAYDHHYGVALVRSDGSIDWGHGWDAPGDDSDEDHEIDAHLERSKQARGH